VQNPSSTPKRRLCMVAVVVGLQSASAVASAKCIEDADCKAGRVCQSGRCVVPPTATGRPGGPAVPAPAPAAPPTFGSGQTLAPPPQQSFLPPPPPTAPTAQPSPTPWPAPQAPAAAQPSPAPAPWAAPQAPAAAQPSPTPAPWAAPQAPSPPQPSPTPSPAAVPAPGPAPAPPSWNPAPAPTPPSPAPTTQPQARPAPVPPRLAVPASRAPSAPPVPPTAVAAPSARVPAPGAGQGATSDPAQLAKQLFDANRFADAAVEFDRAYRATFDPALLYNLGICYRKLKDSARALTAYQEYLLRMPETPHRANVEARMQELEADITDRDAALVAASPTAGKQRNGKPLFAAGQFAKAAAEFEKAFKSKSDPALLYAIAVCHLRAGNLDRAMAAYHDYWVRVPESALRATVELRIREIRRQQELRQPPAGIAQPPR
jgi:Cys-rich repeat protein